MIKERREKKEIRRKKRKEKSTQEKEGSRIKLEKRQSIGRRRTVTQLKL